MTLILFLIVVEICLIQYGIWDYKHNREGSTFIYGYSQNLNDGWADQKVKTLGPMWKQGRAWQRIGEMSIRSEWNIFGKSSTGISYTFADDEDDIQFHLAIYGLFAFWLSFNNLPFLHAAFREIRSNFGYETGIRFFDGAIWVDVLHNDMWGSGTMWNWMPRGINFWKGLSYKDYNNWHGFSFSIHYIDILLGSRKRNFENIGDPVELYAVIEPDTTLLGKSYKVIIQMQKEWWTRPRWFSTKPSIYGDVKCDPPISEPGKGESDWDLGDNDLMGGGFHGSDPQLVLENVIASVMKQREKYGLPDSIQLELGKEEKRSIEENW